MGKYGDESDTRQLVEGERETGERQREKEREPDGQREREREREIILCGIVRERDSARILTLGTWGVASFKVELQTHRLYLA